MQITKKKLQEAIKETTGQMQNKQPDDDDINLDNLDKQGIHNGPLFHKTLQREVDQVAIDELLMSVPKNEGYYLRLWKENATTNRYELKDKISDFHSVADLPMYVTELVRKRTIKAPNKWGSGTYKVDIFREGGVRGEKYKEMFFEVDAQEENLPNNGSNGGGGGYNSDSRNGSSEIANILAATKDYADPVKFQETLSAAFNKGVESSNKDGDASTNMFISMMAQQAQASRDHMTMVMSMMKEIGTKVPDNTVKDILTILAPFIPAIVNSITAKGPNSEEMFDKTIDRLQKLGMAKSSDPKQQLIELGQMLDVVSKINGGAKGNREWPEILADTLSPFIPQVLGTINNVVDTQKLAMQNRPVTVIPEQPTATVNPPEKQLSNEEQMKAVLNQIKIAIEKQDTTFYPMLKSILISAPGGDVMLDNVKQGNIKAEQLVSMLQSGGAVVGLDNLQYEPAIKRYVIGFMEYITTDKIPNVVVPSVQSGQTIKSVEPVEQLNKLRGECTICGQPYEYDDMIQYNNDKICDEINPETTIACGGTILLKS